MSFRTSKQASNRQQVSSNIFHIIQEQPANNLQNIKSVVKIVEIKIRLKNISY